MNDFITAYINACFRLVGITVKDGLLSRIPSCIWNVATIASVDRPKDSVGIINPLQYKVMLQSDPPEKAHWACAWPGRIVRNDKVHSAIGVTA
jgi:hypothetical protein